MAFREFTYPAVIGQLGLTLAEVDLYAGVLSMSPPDHVAEQIADGVALATAIDTEKARSEFIVAPVLQELRRMHRGQFALFSGVPLDAGGDRGLNGVCDFLLSRTPIQSFPTAPLMAIVEAKNDNTRTGFGQCIASMVALREFNRQANTDLPAVYGATTTGELWRFARLVGDTLTLDSHNHSIADLPKILGILSSIVRRPPA